MSALTQQARAGLHAQRGSPRAGSVFPVGLCSSSRVGSSESQPAMLQIDFRFFGSSSRFFRTVAGETTNRFSLLRVTSFDWVSSSKSKPAKLQIDFRFFGSADRFFQSVAGKAPNEFFCGRTDRIGSSLSASSAIKTWLKPKIGSSHAVRPLKF